MRISYSAFVIFTVLLLFSSPKTAACGYDWVGECSSSVHLRINGTLDSFIIADCPSGTRFNSLHLGTLQNLSLANAKAITWESCFNNVSGVGLKYRIYEQGGAGGNFEALNLDQDYFTLVGLYTTRYRSKASNINLASGLTVGKTYVLEVYFLAEIDTIGDDFIPETTLLRNNGGQNYKATFTYGGPSASPFVVVPTNVQEPKCHGESNGIIGVSVWGDHTGLFYNWSNINLNFYQQNNLPAGTYTVTVTGASYSESKTIVLGQPEPLIVQSTDIQPINCGGGVGTALVSSGGGTPPYRYLWQNGQTTATATFPNSGTYSVTIFDAHNCFLAYSVNIPIVGQVQQNISRAICTGESIVVHGMTINMAGVYTFNIPGNSGCDTLLTLTVSETNPAALLANLPSNILVTCDAPSVNLCAELLPNAIFQWSKDGIPATANPCLLATAGGVYAVQVTLNGCIATKTIVSEEHLVSPILSASGSLDYILDCYVVDSTAITYYANTNAAGAQYAWLLNGQIVSTAQTFTLYVDGPDILIPDMTVTVKDQFGCEAVKQPTYLISPPPMPPYPFYYFESDFCSGLMKVDFFVSGGNGPFTVTWNDSLIVGSEFFLPSGAYEIKITDADGCVSEFQAQVPGLFYANVEDSPNPNWNTGSISINVPSGWVDFLWSNGSTGPYLHSLAPGEYCVTMTDQNSCAIDTCFVVHGLVATNEPVSTDLQISPNPAAPGDWLDITIPQKLSGVKILIELTDSQGKKNISEKMETSTASLRLRLPEYLPPGIFSLRVLSIPGQAAGKLLIQK